MGRTSDHYTNDMYIYTIHDVKSVQMIVESVQVIVESVRMIVESVQMIVESFHFSNDMLLKVFK